MACLVLWCLTAMPARICMPVDHHPSGRAPIAICLTPSTIGEVAPD